VIHVGDFEMVDQSVLEKWWAQLDYSERMRILYFSDMVEMKVGAGIGAQRTSYSAFRKDIQEVIEKAFLEGREGEGFWFGIKWHFVCPLCKQESWEMGMIWFQSNDPQNWGNTSDNRVLHA
jgi:NADH:ubiquinone oxidoreductase subunit F (NADH-binding)